jgi:hypothetical protein
MDTSGPSFWRRAAIVMAAAVLVSCGGPTEAGPTCRDRVLAKGTAFEDSPAFAIAYSRALAAGHPDLAPLVAAVVRYQARHPDYGSLSQPGDDWSTTGLSSTLALTALVSTSGAQTSDVIRHLTAAAEEGGMRQVLGFLYDDDLYPNDRYGGAAMSALRDAWNLTRRESSPVLRWHQLCPGG